MSVSVMVMSGVCAPQTLDQPEEAQLLRPVQRMNIE